MKAIIGLGNKGEEYSNTRHNIGFIVIDELALQYDIRLKQPCSLFLYGEGNIQGKEAVLVKPLTYMNRSGFAVNQIVKDFSLTPGELVVIHDDIDLEVGNVKKKDKGGDGGHRGIRSIIEQIKTPEFTRIRIGVGRPASPRFAADYVLKPFKRHEISIMQESIGRSIEKIYEEL